MNDREWAWGWAVLGAVLAILGGLIALHESGRLAARQVRVVCHDEWKGRISADMDRDDVIETPCGWVLHFPHRPPGARSELWGFCMIDESEDGR